MRQESARAVITGAGEKALRPQVLAPGDASERWRYFPVFGRRAAEDVTRRWKLAIWLENQEQHLRDYVIRIDPPNKPSQ